MSIATVSLSSSVLQTMDLTCVNAIRTLSMDGVQAAGASVAANKVSGARAALCHDDSSARQGVEDDDLNILCFGGRTMGIAVAWDCTKNFLGARFSGADRHRRRLAKVTQFEANKMAASRDGR